MVHLASFLPLLWRQRHFDQSRAASMDCFTNGISQFVWTSRFDPIDTEGASERHVVGCTQVSGDIATVIMLELFDLHGCIGGIIEDDRHDVDFLLHRCSQFTYVE